MFPALLVAILLGVMASFVVMGLRQHRRAVALARGAHEKYMQFAVDDPFDVPRRYGGWALAAGGHSPRAENVTYGRLLGLPLRAFDFRYEVGHGTGRMTRCYFVIAVETAAPLAPVLMWNDLDAERAPLTVHLHQRRVGRWSYSGSDAWAARLADACGSLGDQGLSIQTHENSLLLCLPAGKSLKAAAWMERAGEIVERLGLSPVAQGAPLAQTH